MEGLDEQQAVLEVLSCSSWTCATSSALQVETAMCPAAAAAEVDVREGEH